MISLFGTLPGLVSVENMWGTDYGIMMGWAGSIGLARASWILVPLPQFPLIAKKWCKA
ncbi:MAG: hypothetical protein OSA81_01555 [Longimicrobiales bacterium]|nr:hypothetical protein [Longimicrobiales bacterium]